MAQDSRKKTAVKKAVKAKSSGSKAAVSEQAPVTKKVASKKKTAARNVVKKKIAAKPATTGQTGRSSISISSEDRWKMIAVIAYHKAEARGFAPGGEEQDWLEAEQEVERLITG